MNRTRQIVVDRRTFQIDEEGFQILNSYMKVIENHYKSLTYGKEIVEDIESRVSELFWMNAKNSRHVITVEMVKDVIAAIGTPEAIDGDLEDAPHFDPSNYAEAEAPAERPRKRFFRDIETKKIGGVCAGLAHYINMDTSIVRIAAVVLVIMTFGYTVLVYMVLWLLAPPARSTAQKLEMRGENVTIKNIQESIEREFEALRKKFSSK